MEGRCEALTKMGIQCRRNAVREGRCTTHRLAGARAINYFSPQDLDWVNGNNNVQILSGLANLNRIRTVEHVQQFLASNILDRVLTLFLQHRSVHVRDNSCWVLTNLASVAEDRTGAEAILGARPQMMSLFLSRLVAEGNPHLRSSMLWCLANIASSGEDFARRILDEELHTLAGGFLDNPAHNTNLRRNATFLVRVLVCAMTREEALGSLAQLEEIPPAILLDTNVLSDLLWAIHDLYEKTATLGGITPAFLVNILQQTSARFLSPALRTIGGICASDDRPLINRFLNSNLLPALCGILNRPVFTRDVLWVFSNLAVDPEGANALLETSGLLFDLGLLTQTHSDAVWTLSNLATRGSKAIIQKLVRCGIPVVLMELLKDNLTAQGRNLCLEGIMGMLIKNPVATGSLIAPHVGIFQRYVGAPNVEAILGLLARGGIEAPAVTETPPIPYTPSGGATTALGRLADEGSRNEEKANVDDLVFTAQDVAYMIGNGVVFHADGSIAGRT
jgi:hypothetical protein